MTNPTKERIPGTRDIAIRIDNAYTNFAGSLAELADLSCDIASALARFYIKKKLAKLDPIIGRISVKHGAYLNRDAILRAVDIMNGEKRS